MAIEGGAGMVFPRQDGDVTVLGPEVFVSADGSTISFRGENYYRADAPHVMPAHAVDGDGVCAECGQLFPHRGTCSWSLMRSGFAWLPPRLLEEAERA